MNLVTKENVFITCFIIVVVLSIQYIIFLELKKYTSKEIKRVYLSKNNTHKIQESPQSRQTKNNNLKINKLNEDIYDTYIEQNIEPNIEQNIEPNVNTDNNTDNNTDVDTNSDSICDSNCDSYINPLPSINDNINDNINDD